MRCGGCSHTGAASNFWCPSFENETRDKCFDDFPILKEASDHIPQGAALYPTPNGISDLSAFIDICKLFGCVPLITINSGIALRYGPERCVNFYIKVRAQQRLPPLNPSLPARP
jgi:hypothetical protein